MIVKCKLFVWKLKYLSRKLYGDEDLLTQNIISKKILKVKHEFNNNEIY